MSDDNNNGQSSGGNNDNNGKTRLPSDPLISQLYPTTTTKMTSMAMKPPSSSTTTTTSLSRTVRDVGGASGGSNRKQPPPNQESKSRQRIVVSIPSKKRRRQAAQSPDLQNARGAGRVGPNSNTSRQNNDTTTNNSSSTSTANHMKLKSRHVAGGTIRGITKTGRGLPSFNHRSAQRPTQTTKNTKNSDDNFDDNVDDDDEFGIDDDIELPSDTLMAIDTIIRSDQGLYIPLSHNQSVQAVIDRQIYARFNDDHVSVIHGELYQLLSKPYQQSLIQLSLQGTATHTSTTHALIKHDDYIRAVWDAHTRYWFQRNYHNDNASSSLSSSPSRQQDDVMDLGRFILKTPVVSSSNSQVIVQWFTTNLRTILTTSSTQSSNTISSTVIESLWNKTNSSTTTMIQQHNDDIDDHKVSNSITTDSDNIIGAGDVIRHLIDLQVFIRDAKMSMKTSRGTTNVRSSYGHSRSSTAAAANGGIVDGSIFSRQQEEIQSNENNVADGAAALTDSASGTTHQQSKNQSRSISHEMITGQFRLWLPQWGQVLKALSDGRKQIVTLLKRSPRKELSKMNILKKNRHPYLSTQFLLDDLVQNGTVEVEHRPFGTFYHLPRN